MIFVNCVGLVLLLKKSHNLTMYAERAVIYMKDYSIIKNQFEQLGFEIIEGDSLSQYTSFKIGGKCELIVKPICFSDVQSIIKLLNENDIEYYFLGNGSNVLVSDYGFDGVIILISNNLAEIKIVNENIIESAAGVTLAKLCSFALDNSLSGLEFAYGIPGTVGGAVYMNAGAYGGEIKDVIKSCTFIDCDGEIKTFTGEMLDLSYRHSIFSDTKKCILKAEFELKKTDKIEIKTKMDDFMFRRKSKQPLEFPSAGSTFKRPKGNYASALIEECGLKGHSIGGAMVSEKHSGFIINAGNATCEDVLTLVEYVKKDVFEKTGYKLECEIKTLGR